MRDKKHLASAISIYTRSPESRPRAIHKLLKKGLYPAGCLVFSGTLPYLSVHLFATKRSKTLGRSHRREVFENMHWGVAVGPVSAKGT